MPSPYPRPIPTVRSRWPAFLTDGALSAALSAATLMWRGHRERGRAAAPLDAASHRSLAHTGTGRALHVASSMLWGGLYSWLRHRRMRPTAGNALADAALVGGLAAWLDPRLMPPRLAPGFERKLSRPDVGWAYVALAAGLALGGLKELSDERRR